MTLTLTILLAVELDYWLGEPCDARHPLVMFGRWVAAIERWLLAVGQSPVLQRLSGSLAVLIALAPALLCLIKLPDWPVLTVCLEVLVLYFCIAARSLQQHAHAIYQALDNQDLQLARIEVGKIVSRQTGNMTELQVRQAAIESVLENGADAVFAPLFWFVLAGPLGAVLYRLSNTLDAMWGYKNTRYLYFGWAAARLDDLLNWLPARLTAFSYALLGNTTCALTVWRKQAYKLDSPNAGPVMTAGAGALGLKLGGPAFYHGQLKQKPWFGGERNPEDADIVRSWRFMYQTLMLWLILIAAGDVLA